MIQALDVLGKKYNDIKKLVVRTDFDTETLESFSKAGINPTISEGKFNDDLYIFDFKVEKYKVDFFKDKIANITFVAGKNETLKIISNFMKMNDFKFQFITKEQVEQTEWQIINDNVDSEENFTEFKRKRFEFDESSEFDIDDINKYSFMTFHSNHENIIIREESKERDQIFVFELSPNLHEIYNREDFLNLEN